MAPGLLQPPLTGFSAKAKYVTFGVVSMQIVCMFFTYFACVYGSGRCPKLPQLPTISNTWDSPPGNYVSRFVVSIVATIMTALNFLLFLPSGPVKNYKTFRTIGCVSTACLSAVGAICDASWDQCRGNDSIHTAFAITFFIGYNLNMGVFSFAHTGRERLELGLPALLSVLSKLRWLPSAFPATFAPVDETLLAIVEWSDVFLICIWTGSTVWTKRADYSCYIHSQLPANPVCKLTARHLMYGVVGIYMGTILTTTAIYFAQGRGTKGSWPYISDTWVYPPGDWISRWAVELGGTCTITMHAILFMMDTHALGYPAAPPSQKLLTAVAIIAVLGIDVVGCVNESENLTYHLLGAATFFGGYDVYMIGRTILLSSAATTAVVAPSGGVLGSPIKTTSTSKATSARFLAPQLALAALSSSLTYLRFFSIGPSGHLIDLRYGPTGVDSPSDLAGPILEWLNAAAIIGYLSLAVFSHSSLVDTMGVSIAPTV